jgi:alkylation response protein AidB-like acyl-CoA dehydrogenase
VETKVEQKAGPRVEDPRAAEDDAEILRDLLRRFLDKEVPPETAQRWDREDHVPCDILNSLSELGVCGLTVPEEYGGMGRDVLGMVTTIQELARRSVALAYLFIMNACYGSLNIVELGSPEQKRRLLPGLCKGRITVAYGLSEPDVGADLPSVTTRAERHGDTILINGAKRWCTGAAVANYIYMLVRSGPAEARHKNLSLVLVPPDAPGVTLHPLGTMGIHGLPTNDVILENVEVPLANLVGGEAAWNRGWLMLAGPSLDAEKLGVPALAVGTAEAAVAEAWEYSQQRRQFGKRICAIQSIRHKLAEAQTQLAACKLVLAHAARKVHARQRSAVETSMAKLFVADTARDIVVKCQEVMGAYGYAHGFAMERYVRDVMIMPIWGGSSAIQKNNIANLMWLPQE